MGDKQKARVYKSEAKMKTDPDFKTVAECQKYVNKVLADKLVRKQFQQFDEITVTDGRGCRSASARVEMINGRQFKTINLPKWSRSRYVILHELAHHLQKGQFIRIGQDELAYQSHGAKFLATLLWLVKHELGNDVHDEFCYELWQNQCKTLEDGRIVSVSRPNIKMGVSA